MNACQQILNNKDVLYGLGLIAYAGLEFWLGKTDKIKAASLVEAGLNLVMKKSPEDSKDGQAL